MQLARDFRVFTIVAGMVTSATGPLVGQQLPNQGQQPAATSPYPSASDGLPGGSTNAKTGSVGDTMGDAQSRQMDKRFLTQVMQASVLNVALGKMAAEKSTNDAVKQFGQKMATDHERGDSDF